MGTKLTLGASAAAFALLAGVTAVQAADRTVIQNKGSDTLVNVAQAWAENYRDVDANVAVAVSGGGSGTGIAAMINGTVDIANASRSMKDKEVKLAKSKGQNPLEHVVGYDALAVFIHKDNPADKMGLDQLAQIFLIFILGYLARFQLAGNREFSSGRQPTRKMIVLGVKDERFQGYLFQFIPQVEQRISHTDDLVVGSPKCETAKSHILHHESPQILE